MTKSKIYRVDFHTHTKYVENSFRHDENKSRVIYFLKNYWKTALKGLFVKRAVYKKIRPKSDVTILDGLKIPESNLEPETAVEQALKNGMTFAAITNHNDVNTAIYASKKYPGNVLIGEEISVVIDKKRMMHVLIYFLNYSKGELKYSRKNYEEIRKTHAGLQKYRENLEELILFLKKDKNIVMVCAHPFTKSAFSRFIFTKHQKIDKDIERLISENFNLVEVMNGSCAEMDNFLSREFALKHGLGFSAGSDSHEIVNDVEKGIISMPGSTYIEARAKNAKDLFKKMQSRKVRIVGTKYKLDKIKRLYMKKLGLHTEKITNRIDRLVVPFAYVAFIYALHSHFAGYRTKLKRLAIKMGLSLKKYSKEEYNGVTELRKMKKR